MPPPRVVLGRAKVTPGSQLRQIGSWVTWMGPVVLGTLAPLLAILASGHTLAWRDTASLFAPVRPLVVQALHQFRLPLWNPYEACGVPLFGQLMHGVLHPVSVLGALLAPQAGMDLFIVAHTVLGAIGAALLARLLGCSPGGASVAGLGYGLSGYLLSMSSNVQYLAAAGTAPWAIAALRQARGAASVAIASFVVAALLFAGDPQWALVAVCLGLALAAEGGGRRALLFAGAAAALGTLLASIQLLPAWVFLAQSSRGASGLPSVERLQWALAPARIVEFAAPGFFWGRPGVEAGAPVFQRLGGPTVYNMPFVPSVFLGAPLLAMAVAGGRVRRIGGTLAAAAAVLLWAAMGHHLGSEQALRAVPIWGSFRYSEKLIGPFTLCVALLAGAGADRLVRAHTRGWVAAIFASALAAGASALCGVTGAGEELLYAAGAGDAAHLAQAHLGVGFSHASLSLAGFGIALLAVLRRPTWSTLFPWLAAVLVFLDSVAASPHALHAGVRWARETKPLQRIASSSASVRLATPLKANGAWALPGLDDHDSILAAESRMGVPAHNVAGRVDQISTYTGLTPRSVENVFAALQGTLGPVWWQALRRFGVSHVAAGTPINNRDAEILAAAVAGGSPVLFDTVWRFTVWEVPHRPWASFAETVRSVSSEGEALALLLTSAEGELSGVVAEGDVPHRLSPGRIFRIKREPERLYIEAECSGEGLLVVNDAWWPGWTAQIDGSPASLLRADCLVRAVPWPGGKHVVEISYHPLEVLAGALASAVALLWLGVLFAIGIRKPRNARRGQRG